MGWRQFVMDLESHDPETVEAILLEHGAHAVTLTDAGDRPVLEPAPGETPLTRIGYFTTDQGLWRLSDCGALQPISAGGYEH